MPDLDREQRLIADRGDPLLLSFAGGEALGHERALSRARRGGSCGRSTPPTKTDLGASTLVPQLAERCGLITQWFDAVPVRAMPAGHPHDSEGSFSRTHRSWR